MLEKFTTAPACNQAFQEASVLSPLERCLNIGYMGACAVGSIGSMACISLELERGSTLSYLVLAMVGSAGTAITERVIRLRSAFSPNGSMST